jgi:uncharacterized RDD family membrane protein YckC
MKCPKCGYLGFETTERCRNCQYDFSLTPFVNEPELTLHDSAKGESPSDLQLAPSTRHNEAQKSTPLDLDRLFGDPDAPLPAPVAVAPAPPPIKHDQPEPASDPAPGATADAAALPFDDVSIVPPPAARPPLAVRRSTPEVVRNRPRTTRPVRSGTLGLESQAAAASSVAEEAEETIQSLLEPPSLGVRVGAGLIDLLLLVGIDAAVLYLTLKVTGLQSTLEDLLVLPTVPFVGFLALLAFGYVAAFTVAGGQTIGKMVLNLRVIGDDGRPIDAAGGMLRALGCMLVPVTFGLSYLPALFTSDHRAIHDRLAGTRVVQE